MTNFLFFKSQYIKQLGFFILLFMFCSGMNAQNTVSGTVSGSDGPIPGANVILKGTSNGAATNFDGEYTIKNVPANGVLVVSFLGYKTKEVTINNQKVINVILDLDTAALDEVVVIGYGTQRKESVTGSVASIKGEEMRDVPSANITQSLQGRVSGVEFAQNSSKPGASMQIRVRGTRSLNASNDPLIVLDGIPFAGSIGDINPTDIKSVDILKDASATAIYGSRGANGVILVTTNKGSKGQEAKINYTSYFGVKNVFAKYPMMNSEDFIKLRSDAGIFSNGLDESNDVNTDWQDLLYGTAIVTSHDIGISGGGDKSNYNFGLGYYKDESVLPGQDYERISLRASIDQEIGENIKVGFTTNNSYSVSNGNSLGIYGALNSTPIANPYNADGSLKRVISMPLDDQWVYTRSSIEALGDSYIDQTKSFGSYNSIYGVLQIPGIKGLSYRLNLGLNYRQSNGGNYVGEGVFNVNATTVSTAAISNSHTTSWTIENILSYDRTFADKHNFNALVLYSSEENSFNRSRITAKDIPADAFQFYNLGRANEQPIINPDDQLYSVSGLQSMMGRIMYSYDDRYMLSASYRYDGSSRLADSHKWVSYPAISVGWNIKNESFMDNVELINSLKVRAGYGTTSNQSIDPYSTLGRLGATQYNFGNTYTTGLNVSELPNPNLGWEKSTTMNYGLDFGLLNNRLSGTVDYYATKTTDLLFRVGLPQTSGVSSYMANIGESENKGFEVALNGVLIDNPNGFTWEAGINVYTNDNKLTKLASGTERDESNWWFVGQPIDVIYDYKAEGIWQQGDPYLNILEPGGNVGMIKVKYTGDYNPDGSPVRAIGPADRQIMSMQPDFQGGFNTRLAYKGIDFSIVGTFKSGGLLIATPYGANGYLNILTGRRGNIDVDYWTADNTDAKYPKPGGIGGDQPKYLNSLSYFDASYLKIRTITLGYNFEKSKFIKDSGIDRLRLYVTAQNPLVFFSPYKKASGMDPETNSAANENSAVTYNYNLRRLLTIGTNTPTTTNYVIGLNISF
ncbi:SusC/RagA family TonB-linked outer membrane protein [Mariniflexile jejuense]|uniref:SusC/RagA family TonB-linked outer membrane protein n=1 Tax=Mariniflexile jejuense TaxID=1173582 RepID=A0ABW3JHD4_9FLAO